MVELFVFFFISFRRKLRFESKKAQNAYSLFLFGQKTFLMVILG